MAEPPDPGSHEAIALGCVCSPEANNHGLGWVSETEPEKRVFTPANDCALHGLAAVLNRVAEESGDDGDRYEYDPASKTLRQGLDRIMTDRLAFIRARREQLVEAWLAEAGLAPSESVLVQRQMPDGTVRIWVERRES